jgi:hypothetical protein
MNCPNCKSPITCGCQKRVASDGKQVCTKCLEKHEAKLKEEKDKKS